MRRAELDLPRREWHLPGARTKNGHAHCVAARKDERTKWRVSASPTAALCVGDAGESDWLLALENRHMVLVPPVRSH